MRRSQGVLPTLLDDLGGRRWYENKKPQDILRLSQIISKSGLGPEGNMSIDSLILLLQNTQDLKSLAEQLMYMQNIQSDKVRYHSCLELLRYLNQHEPYKKSAHILFE